MTEEMLHIKGEALTKGKVPIDIYKDKETTFKAMADLMCDTILENNKNHRKTLFICPLGPIGQYKYFASRVNEERINLKDVTFINMDYGASAAALANNQIQASYVDVSNYADVIKLNVNFLVDTARPEDSAKYLKSEVFPSQIVVATAKFVEENPETVQAFINAFHRATLWMHENSDEAVADALVPYYAGLTKEGLVDRVKIVKKSLTKTGYIGEKEEEFVQKYCMENGVIPRMIPYEEIVDMTFVNNVNKNK